MKENKINNTLMIFVVAACMCFGSASIVFATPFTGTPSPSLDPVLGTLIDFDDKPGDTPIDEFDYVDQGVASIKEMEGLGTFARYDRTGAHTLPNYIGTGSDGERGTDTNTYGWDGTIMIELVYPTNVIGIGISDSQGDPEILTIYDSSMNLLETQTAPTGSKVYCGFERNTYDIKYFEITGDFFALDDLQFNRVNFETEKVITDAEYYPPEFVPIYTNAWWDLEITVTNTGDADLDQIWVYDGIGAKLDLVVQSDGTGSYIFTDDSGPLYFDDAEDDEYFGETGPVSWALANGKEPKPNGKHSATTLTWDAEDLEIGEDKHLSFRVQTIPFQTGKNDKNDKQAFTSTCHHYINDGPIAMVILGINPYFYWGEPVMVSVYCEDPEADSDGDGYYDLEEVNEWGTDPCCPDSHPIFVSGFNTVRSRAPIGDSEAEIIEDELLDTDNFGWHGTVPCPIIFLDFVETIETESLVDDQGNLLCDVFFAGLTATPLTNDESVEFKNFLNAGGILYISGNSGSEGESYHPLFTELGWLDTFSGSQVGGGETSTPIITPITTGPFGIVGPLDTTPFRPILYSSTTCVAEVSSSCIVAEAAYGLGYISITGDPLFFDLFMGDDDNLNYYLNLFALAV